MKLKRVWLMCGISGSGKSTWINKHLTPTSIWCSRDNVRFSMVKENEEYFSHETEVFNTWINNIKNALNNPKVEDVYIDATHINKASRSKTLSHLKGLSFELNFVVFKVPLKICLERNAQREGRARVPDKVIKNMYNNFTMPYGNVIIVNEKGEVVDNGKNFSNF